MERVRTDRAAELIADTQELKTLKAEPAEGGVSTYAQHLANYLNTQRMNKYTKPL